MEQLALIPTVDQQREISQSFCITFHDAVAPLEIRLGQGDNPDYVTVTKNGITAYFLTSPEESSALIKHLTEQFEQYKQSSKESPLGRIPGQMISMYLQKGTADYSEEISSTALPRVIAMLCDLNLTEIDSEATRLKKGDYCLTGAGGATEMRVILRENRMYYSYRQNTTTAEGEWQTAWYSFPATEADELYALLDQEWSAADNRLQHLLVEEKPTRLSFHMQSSSQILLFDGGDVHDQESLNEIAELIRSHVQERSNGPFKADADPDGLTLYLTFSRIDGASIYCEINQDRLSISQEYLGSHTESNYHGAPSTYRIDPEATAELLAYLENYLPGADIVIPDEVANFGNKAAIRYALARLGLTLTERVDHLALVSDEFFQTKEALCFTWMQYDTPQQAPVLTMFWNYTLDTPLSAQEIAELHAEDRSDRKVVRFTEEELLTILSTYFAEMPMDAQTLHHALENSNYYRYLESTNSWYCFVSGSNTIPSPLATYLTESGELVVFLDSGGMAVLREVDGSYRFVAHRKIA